MAVDAATTGRGADGGTREGEKVVCREGGEGREETERRWAEVVGRRWRRARHSMTCHVPTLPLTHPLARLDAAARHRPLRPAALQPPSPRARLPRAPPRREDACVYIWKILARPPSNKPTRARYTYPADSSYEVYSCPRVWKADVGSGDRALLCATTY